MNNTVITNVGDRSIYFIKEGNISFYLNMPVATVKNVSIGINLLDKMDAVNLGVNAVDKVKEEITRIYSDFSDNDVVMVTPVLDTNVSEQLKLNNNEKIFVYTDKYISFLINQVYNLLAKASITVNSIIKLNNNASYKNFNDWFVAKYKGRVELVSFNKTNVPNGLNPFDNSTTASELTQDVTIANQVLDSTSDIDTIRDDDVAVEPNVREPGFVSYVLLGVIVVVISLVILYMLL